jgi:glycosyltransferase involved in cell wall biosynthesis
MKHVECTFIVVCVPFFKHVSFGVIGQRHYDLLRQYLRVELVDENAFPSIQILSHPLVFSQPYFYLMQMFEKKIARNLSMIYGLIGVDVADSDRITRYAKGLTKHATAMIVPSTFSKQSYLNSGVKKPIHVIPHGIDTEWLDTPPLKPTAFTHLAHLKKTKKLKLILCYALHSDYRKGLDLLLEFYNKLLTERDDTMLVVKTTHGVRYSSKPVTNLGSMAEIPVDGKILRAWLTPEQKMELFDLCDIYFLSSRGGAFEHPALEGLARGEIVLGAKGGSWEDYLPNWALIPSTKSGPVLAKNPIHSGCGVELNVDKAVEKTVDIFNNLDDYRARVREHVSTHVRENFLWEQIGLQLRDVALEYMR